PPAGFREVRASELLRASRPAQEGRRGDEKVRASLQKLPHKTQHQSRPDDALRKPEPPPGCFWAAPERRRRTASKRGRPGHARVVTVPVLVGERARGTRTVHPSRSGNRQDRLQKGSHHPCWRQVPPQRL